MSSADTARKVQGFLSATARPRCGNCRHSHEDIADRMPPYDTRTWRCRRGGFVVSAGAICNRWERDGVRAAPSTPTTHPAAPADTVEPQDARDAQA